MTFVFGALLEFALVNYASRSDAHREKMKKQRKQWEMEREREQLQQQQQQQSMMLEGAASTSAAPIVETRLEDGSTTFAMVIKMQYPLAFLFVFSLCVTTAIAQ